MIWDLRTNTIQKVVPSQWNHQSIIWCASMYPMHRMVKKDRLFEWEWEDDFRAYVGALKEKKPVIVTGDMNVAKEEIDLKNPKSNRGNADFLIRNVIRCGNCWQADLWIPSRYLYPEQTEAYSWWSYRFKARERNAGWRIDYFLVSEEWRTGSKTARFCRISLAVITVRWN